MNPRRRRVETEIGQEGSDRERKSVCEGEGQVSREGIFGLDRHV